MNSTIIAAIITAAAAIIGALIGLFNKKKGKSIVVKQRAKGKDIQQIGVQIGKREEQGKHER